MLSVLGRKNVCSHFTLKKAGSWSQERRDSDAYTPVIWEFFAGRGTAAVPVSAFGVSSFITVIC